MKSKQFPSFEAAKAYLEERGKLEFFGRAGAKYEFCVYNLHLKDGRRYHVDVYDDGKIVVRGKIAHK